MRVRRTEMHGHSRRALLKDLLVEDVGPGGVWTIVTGAEAVEARRYVDAVFGARVDREASHHDFSSTSALRAWVIEAVTENRFGRDVIVHFQDSRTLGVLACPTRIFVECAVDLLQFDGENLVVVTRDSDSLLLVDVVLEGAGQSFSADLWT